MNKKLYLTKPPKRIDSEKKCAVILDIIKVNKHPNCRACDSSFGHYLHKPRKLLQCKNCGYQESLTAGTIFHGTRVPLVKWFWMIFLKHTLHDEVSVMRMQKSLNIKTYKTAWRMHSRIEAEPELPKEIFQKIINPDAYTKDLLQMLSQSGNKIKLSQRTSNPPIPYYLKTEEACKSILYNICWPDGYSCIRCENEKHFIYPKSNMIYCSQCGKKVSLTAGTILNSTKVPIRKWLQLVYFLVYEKHENYKLTYLQKRLKLTYKTVQRMSMKIRSDEIIVNKMIDYFIAKQSTLGRTK